VRVRSPSHRLSSALFLLGLCAALLAPRAEALTVAGFGDSMTWAPGYLAQLPAEWDTVNLSLGGEVSWDGLLRLQGLLPTLEADVLVVMEGTNDVRDLGYSQDRSVESLSAMMDAALAQGLEVVLMAPPPLLPYDPNGDPLGPNGLLASLAGALGDAAAARGVPFVDLFALFTASPSMESYYLDLIHPNETGSGVIAAAAATAITQTIAPEPETSVLVGAGLALLASRRPARSRVAWRPERSDRVT
jgi:lysophospholipase L1-like esterase